MGDGSEEMEVSDIKPDDNVNLSNEEEQAVRLASSNNGDSVKDLLDEVEDQVEKVRSEAMAIIEAKEDIQTTLEMLSSQDQLSMIADVVERSEVEAILERLTTRLNAITVDVSTSRSNGQQESLHRVNQAIDTLIVKIQTDTDEANVLCRTYLSATGSEDDSPTDAKFEQHLLGCTIEDQKSVRKRLVGLHQHIKAIVSDNIKETTTE